MNIQSQLENLVGPRGLMTGTSLRDRTPSVGSPHAEMAAQILVRPESTEAVAAILQLCHESSQTVITHGGLTGLVDGIAAGPEDLILSLERMNKIEEIDTVAGTMTVQAGVTLQQVQEAADAADMLFPLDLGARGSATIGGNIATNAGGNRVLRYGMMRDMVLGMETVLADGRVLSSMNKIIKDNAGYNLKQLFIGSEGTLGVVTRAILRLRPKPRSQQTAFVAVEKFHDLPNLLNFLNQATGGNITAFEAIWQNFYKLITIQSDRQPPVPPTYPLYALIEALGGDQAQDQERFEAALAEAYENGMIVDAAVAQSQSDRDAMWALRDDVEAMHRIWGPSIGFDISLPPSDMEDYLAEVDDAVRQRWPERKRAIFGHLGDGNLHLVYVVGDTSPETKTAVDHMVYLPLQHRGGSVSAEHGIGLKRKPFLAFTRSDVEIDVMRGIKRTLDPKNILNPGKIL